MGRHLYVVLGTSILAERMDSLSAEEAKTCPKEREKNGGVVVELAPALHNTEKFFTLWPAMDEGQLRPPTLSRWNCQYRRPNPGSSCGGTARFLTVGPIELLMHE
jgi:hypothetical protein